MNTTETRWGQWTVLADEPGVGFKVKILAIMPGHHISLQYHNHRMEHWSVVAGSGELMVNGMLMKVNRGDNIYIPQGAEHKARNTGNEPFIIVETQIGEECSEADIVRLEDISGYTPTLVEDTDIEFNDEL